MAKKSIRKAQKEYPRENYQEQANVIQHAQRAGKSLQIENAPVHKRSLLGYSDKVKGTGTAPSRNAMAASTAGAVAGGVAALGATVPAAMKHPEAAEPIGYVAGVAGGLAGSYAGKKAYDKFGKPTSMDYGQAKRAYLQDVKSKADNKKGLSGYYWRRRQGHIEKVKFDRRIQH